MTNKKFFFAFFLNNFTDCISWIVIMFNVQKKQWVDINISVWIVWIVCFVLCCVSTPASPCPAPPTATKFKFHCCYQSSVKRFSFAFNYHNRFYCLFARKTILKKRENEIKLQLVASHLSSSPQPKFKSKSWMFSFQTNIIHKINF